jgi:hypothetical protein
MKSIQFLVPLNGTGQVLFSTPALRRWLWAVALVLAGLSASFAQLPRPDHIVIVIEENHSYTQILQSYKRLFAPYINQLATQGASFTNSHGITHPSQPNYLELFSGTNQRVTTDENPTKLGLKLPFDTPNLGAEFIASGYSFTGYSESLPSTAPFRGFEGDAFSTVPGQDQYMRKHNPWVNWLAEDAPANNHLPPAFLNAPFETALFDFGPILGLPPGTLIIPLPGFPSAFTQLPTVSIVVPNEVHDMHSPLPEDEKELPPNMPRQEKDDIKDLLRIARADAWLKDNLDAYIQWAKSPENNSLFILTWDENETPAADNSLPAPQQNQIPTIIIGPSTMVRPGQYDQRITHHNVLRTIEDMYGLAHAGNAVNVAPITSAFIMP